MEYSNELKLACRAAKQAGTLLKQLMTQEMTVLSELGRDIKIQADRDAETQILNILSESPFPVLAEESGEHGQIDMKSTFWIVDPLDGTYNFSRGIPYCCVAISLMDQGIPAIGVIYDFNRDELYTGLATGGAWLNNKSMSVSGVVIRERATLMTGMPMKIEQDNDSLKEYLSDMSSFERVLMEGSAALMMAHVACGRADAYREDDVMIWDIAAGSAIIKGAGGFVNVESRHDKKWGCAVRCGASAELWMDCDGDFL